MASEVPFRSTLLSSEDDPSIIIWTKLHILESELTSGQWKEYFRPLIHATGHCQTLWGQMHEAPGTIMIATLWYTTSEHREFWESPSAQLYRESLLSTNIQTLEEWTTVYHRELWFHSLTRSFVQLLWLHFPASVEDSEARLGQIRKLRGFLAPAMGFSVPHSKRFQTRRSVQMWAAPMVYQEQDVKVMLWPHFWGDAEKATWRLTPWVMEEFTWSLEEVGATAWKEELYNFEMMSLP